MDETSQDPGGAGGVAFWLKRKKLPPIGALDMYLVPYLLLEMPGASDIRQVWIFLERNGTHLLSLEGATEAAAIAEALAFADTNELSTLGPPQIVKDLVFLKIDPTDKDLAAFYSWKEVPPGTIPPREAWRSFLWVGGGTEGLNEQLSSISIGPAPHHTVFEVVRTISSTSP